MSAPRTFMKRITVQLGIMPIHLKMETAVLAETSASVVCTNGGQHEAVKVKQSVFCPVCKTTHNSFQQFPERGIEENKQIRVLSKDDIQQVKGAPRTGRVRDGHQHTLEADAPVEIKFHPRLEVFAFTLAGDSVQNVYPDTDLGGAKAYEMLLHYLSVHPDQVAVMVWAPTKNNALWVLDVYDGRLVASKRTWPEQVREPKQVAPVTITGAEQTLFDQIIELTLTRFDVNEYVNEAAKGLQELLDGAEGAPSPEPDLSVDNLAMLQSLLASVKAQKASTREKAA